MLPIGKALSYALSLPVYSGFHSLMRNPILASNTAGYVEVTSCSDGTFCCGHSNSICCNDVQGYNINANGQLQGSQVTPTAELSTMASSTPSIRPLSSEGSANNQSDSSDDLSKNQQVAIGVAIPTVAAVIALLAWCLPRGQYSLSPRNAQP